MIEVYVNPFGVNTCICNNGVLLTYALNANEEIELYFPDLQTALDALSVPDIAVVTAFDLTSLYFMG